MLVGKNDISSVVGDLSRDGFYALDTETTGLFHYLGDAPFSVVIHTGVSCYYLNFQQYEGLDQNFVLDKSVLVEELAPVFANPASTWFMQNAKFDLGMLARDGVRVTGLIHDTEVVARLLKSNYQRYNLDILLTRMNEDLKQVGPEKLDIVKQHIKKHKLYTVKDIPGKDKQQECWHAERVPLDIMRKYAEMDAEGTWKLGMYQRSRFGELKPEVLDRERALTISTFHVEQNGFRINRQYTQAALDFELGRKAKFQSEFEAMTGEKYVDSYLLFDKLFRKEGIELPLTPKGTPQTDEETLSELQHPLANVILKEREASKKAGTYYASFLFFADKNDRVHANYRQSATKTGRFSCQDPNLQNVPKEEDLNEVYIARRCFIPSPGHALVMIDYDQMEYRLLLDACQQTDVIQEILGGLDVHEATAKMMGVNRNTAKTINFMLLYGGGAAKLAKSLGISEVAAKDLKRLYFSKLPKVKDLTYLLTKKAEIHGRIENWAGRYSYVDKGFEYKAPNYYIQGGCADIVKEAMNMTCGFLNSKGSKIKMVAQVHDELVFDCPLEELETMEEVKEIMESCYPYTSLPLTCGMDYSLKSWADKKEWVSGEETRNQIQGEVLTEVKATT